jgi:1,4-dihydroxy-2-naphthoate octaprenyltransferase
MTMLALGASIPVGSLATALLVVNNLRDIPTDTASGKRTLAVRLGDQDTRLLYLVLLTAVPIGAALLLAVVRPLALLSLLGIAVGVPAVRAVRQGDRGRDLIPVLVRTGRVQLVYGVLLAAGLAVAR